jgi:lupus La protein
MSALTEQVRKQVEFYFSDSNYRRDNFLRKCAESDPEGYIPIATLLTFNKLKALTTESSVIVDAVKDSGIVSVSSDNLKIKKLSELPATDDSAARTLYVKGFPTDDSDVTIDAIAKMFSPYGNILLVKMRRLVDKSFKGSCFIEYRDVDSIKLATEAAYEGGTMKLFFKDKPFDCVMSFSAWLERKKLKKDKKDSSNSNDNRKVGEKRVREESSAENKTEKASKLDYTERLILRVKNIPTDATLMGIKDFFQAVADIKFVEYLSEEQTAYIRTATPQATDTILEAIQKGLRLMDKSKDQEAAVPQGAAEESIDATGAESDKSSSSGLLTGAVLTGEEEEAYWKKIGQGSAQHKRGHGGRGRGGSGGRGGRGRGRGRKGGH